MVRCAVSVTLEEKAMKDRCAIVGVGNTAYTRGTEKTTLELHLEASMAALADAGLQPSDLDAVMPNEISGVIAEDLLINLGIPDLRFTATIRTGGASFVTALQAACMAIVTETAQAVLLVGGRRGYSAQRVSKSSQGSMYPAPIRATCDEFERPYGNTVAAQHFAHAAQRHMYEYGTRSEHFGMIAVACRKHANLNPQAFMHDRPLTLAEHQASRMVADPLHLFDCSLETDGAGAIVVTSAERARDCAKAPVYVSGIAEGHADPPTSITQKRDLTQIEGLRKAAGPAFRMAGVSPADIDCAQLYDGFTWITLASLEAVGFCGLGEGGGFVEGGRIELGGELPVNTAGGLVSEAHCSGVNHVLEAVRQLRGDVEVARQVPHCELVLVTSEGDFHEGAVAILRR